MKKVQVIAKENRNGESLLRNDDARMTQHLYHVFDQPEAAVAVQREDRFGMKLNAFNRQIAVPDAHDDPVVALSRHFETGRQFFRNRVQRVITAHAKFLRESRENTETAMPDQRRLSVHRVSEHTQFPAKRFDDALQSQTHAKYGNFQFRRAPNQLGYAEIRGAARPRRNQDQRRPFPFDQLERESGTI